MVAFVEEVSFELGFHRLLGLGDVQKLGWEKTFWVSATQSLIRESTTSCRGWEARESEN